MSPETRVDTESLLAKLDALLGPAPPRQALPRTEPALVVTLPKNIGPAVQPAPAVAPEPPAKTNPAPVLRLLDDLGPPLQTAAATPAKTRLPAEPKAPPAISTKPSLGSPRVLIVEDNDDYRKVLRYLFTSHGYSVTEAANGADGLKAARAQHQDIALLDFEMPQLNGYELLMELRRRDETRKLPVVFLTGAANRRYLRDLGLDVSRFLDKPITNAELFRVVSSILSAPGLAPADKGANGKPAAAGSTEAAPAAPPDLALEPAPEPEPEPVPEPEPPPLEKFFEDSEAATGDDLLIEEQKKEREEDVAGLDVLANDSPLVNRINKILVQSVEMGASDIHIEPQEKAILVRVRVDGILRQLCRLPIVLQSQVAARVKIMSNLIITERRRSQDGQIRALIKGKKIEFRVSTIPSLYGEKVVLRILGGVKLKDKLEELQLNARDLEVLAKALQSPHGLLLVTGPTGSGKSTTLYTMVRQLNKPDVNIMTAEDPVEYELAGITQVPIRAHIGVTFEAVLRSFLRQDPDIMLVGEIRDLETAEIAVKAAITGHLVLSTLHTNSAPAAVMRLAHMGVAPYLVADSLKLVVAQRLVRRICPKCRVPSPPTEEVIRVVGSGSGRQEKLAKSCIGRGCAACGQSGYKGRMPLFEVMDIRTPELRNLILTNASLDKLTQQAEAEGMRGLRDAALDAVAAGDTTIDEALSIILSE